MLETKAKWIEGYKFAAWDGGGNAMIMDAGKAGGGEGEGVRPIDLPLIALSGCAGMDIIEILRKKRQKVTGFEITVKTDRADSDPKVYKNIVIEYRIEGTGISREKVEQAVRLTEEKYCSVAAMLAMVTDITHKIDIVEV